MRISNTFKAELLLRDFTQTPLDTDCFYLSVKNTEYEYIWQTFNSLIPEYGYLSIWGYGLERNVHNRSEKIQEKLGIFNQNDFIFPLKNNVLIRKFDYQNSLNYFTYLIDQQISYENFLKIINHDYDCSLFIELVPISQNNITDTSTWISKEKKQSIVLLFGRDLRNNLYMLFCGKNKVLSKLKNSNKLNNLEECNHVEYLDFLTYLEKDTEKFSWVVNHILSVNV